MNLWAEFKRKILSSVQLLRENGHDLAADLLEETIEGAEPEQTTTAEIETD